MRRYFLVAVLGAIALSVLVALGLAREWSRSERKQQGLRSLHLALVAYVNENKGVYPKSMLELLTAMEVSPNTFKEGTYEGFHFVYQPPNVEANPNTVVFIETSRVFMKNGQVIGISIQGQIKVIELPQGFLELGTSSVAN